MSDTSFEEALEAAAVGSDDPDLFKQLAECLFRHDPAEVQLEVNVDEYVPEVRTLMPRLPEAQSASDVHRILTEELEQWFGASVVWADRRDTAADEIWRDRQASDSAGAV